MDFTLQSGYHPDSLNPHLLAGALLPQFLFFATTLFDSTLVLSRSVLRMIDHQHSGVSIGEAAFNRISIFS
jgi:hypothetical protein